MPTTDISVVIPAYNASLYIREAIESARLQDPAEIIVVDDGSTDIDYRTLEDGLVRVVRQENRGVSAARNRGCQEARCGFIATLDADDIWLPGKLSRQVAHLEQRPTCMAVFADGFWWNEGQRPDGSVPADAHAAALAFREFILGIPVSPSTMVIRREAWLSLGGFDEGMRFGEDQDFYLRLARRFEVAKIQAKAMVYRRHGASATGSLQEQNHDAEIIYRAIRRGDTSDIDQRTLRHRLGRLHFLHGYEHFWRGDKKVARREFLRAAHTHFTLKTLAYCCLSAIG